MRQIQTEAFMKKPILWVVLFCLCVLSGCIKDASRGAQENEKGPKLKAMLASTDRVLVKDFYASQLFSPAVPPPEISAYQIKTTWLPGHISFEPITVTEPAKENGKEARKLKGIKVEVLAMNFMVQTTKGEQHVHASFLDDDEARDFDNALSYLSSSAAEWRKEKHDHERELTFHSKDQFDVTLAMINSERTVLTESGDYQKALLKIPAEQIGNVQEKLKAALKILDAH
jgi:hypothetical protein